jgi:Tfp pilus assembly protein PilW
VSKSVLARGPDPGGVERTEGWLLLELMIALTVLTVGILGFLFSFQTNFRATHEIDGQDHAQVAMETVVEKLRASDFTTLFANYSNATFPVPGLDAPGGGTASIVVQFFVNETALPAEFAPLVDIDGDGKKTNTNASENYILLPTRLTLSYQDGSEAETKTLSFVLGPSR